MPEFFTIFAAKNIFPDFFLGGGRESKCPSTPVSYACVGAPVRVIYRLMNDRITADV